MSEIAPGTTVHGKSAHRARPRIAFVKPHDHILGDENVIMSILREVPNIASGSFNIYFLADIILLNLAGRVDRDRYEVVHHDEDASGFLTFDEDFDFVYMDVKTHLAPRAYAIADAFRARGATVVLGGLHVAPMSDEALLHADAVVIGEEDTVFDAVLAGWRSGALHKRYKADGFPDLGTLPSPAYDLLAPDVYKMIPGTITRGCPHNCNFCYSTVFFGPRIRTKAKAQIQREVAQMARYSPVSNLFFTDDNMFLDKKNARLIADAMGEMNVRWSTFTDISLAEDPELLKLLSQAGLNEVLIGFESIVPESIRDVSRFKANRMPKYLESIDAIQSAGVGIIGSFVVGFDTDPPDVFDHLADFFIKSMLHEVSISILTPYPGTAIYNQFVSEDRLISRDWARYSDLSWNVNFRPKQMSVSDIEQGTLRALRTVYTPENYRKRVKYFKDQAHAALESAGRIPGMVLAHS